MSAPAIHAHDAPPILHRAWFRPPPDGWPAEPPPAGQFETMGALLGPPLITLAFRLIAGLIAAAPFGPLESAGSNARAESAQ